MRRTLAAGLLAFVAGFAACASAAGYGVARLMTPGDSWWTAAHLAAHLLVWSAVAGLLAARVAASLAGRWYHARGAYRCWQCDRPLIYGRRCVCFGTEPPRLRPRRLRHVRRRVLPVLIGYAAMVPIASIVAAYAVPGGLSFAGRATAFHVLLCVLVGVLLQGTSAFLELLKRARRWRLRIDAFVPVWATWPILALAGLAAWWALGRAAR